MKFTVSSTLLQKNLSAMSGVIPSNPLLPILENFLLVIEEGKLTASATDSNISMVAEVEVDSNETGSIAVPARQLLDTLRKLPEQPLSIEIDEEEQRFEITSYNGRYVLTGENSDDFPRIPEAQEASSLAIPASVLNLAITSTFFAISNDDLRPAMTGLYVNIQEGLTTFVSTDGNRLVKYQRRDLESQDSRSLIIPKKALGLLKSTLPGDETGVKTEFNDSHAFFAFDQFRLVCRLIDETFPDFENAIPQDNPNILMINRSELLNSLDRLSIYSNKTTNQIRFKLEASKLQIFAEDLDFSNEAHESLPSDYQGDDMEIGFNVKFLIEMVSNLQAEEVQFSMSTPRRAGVLVPTEKDPDEEVLMLIMPVMLNTYA